MKRVPENVIQHKTAGPYSPVLLINDFDELVVISGQAPLDLEGNLVGKTIEEHTLKTMENCLTQLKKAGVGFEDVFRVNVYMDDLDEWKRFNDVYKDIMPTPYPARTAVGVKLLQGFKVEIDMWATKKNKEEK
ncbi:RidA family protein [Anaerorhabdus sp.]|uniref:RidA family protein n=1 Tax=Anaerorhabdus sp. TaxID=1872524 RepID=UPI002FCC4967